MSGSNAVALPGLIQNALLAALPALERVGAIVQAAQVREALVGCEEAAKANALLVVLHDEERDAILAGLHLAQNELEEDFANEPEIGAIFTSSQTHAGLDGEQLEALRDRLNVNAVFDAGAVPAPQLGQVGCPPRTLTDRLAESLRRLLDEAAPHPDSDEQEQEDFVAARDEATETLRAYDNAPGRFVVPDPQEGHGAIAGTLVVGPNFVGGMSDEIPILCSATGAIIAATWQVGTDFDFDHQDEQQEAQAFANARTHARRITASFNACMGIPVEQLEGYRPGTLRDCLKLVGDVGLLPTPATT